MPQNSFVMQRCPGIEIKKKKRPGDLRGGARILKVGTQRSLNQESREEGRKGRSVLLT